MIAWHAMENSMLARPVDLNSSLPTGVPVIYRGKKLNVVNFATKEPSFDNRVLLNSFYIAGYSRAGWVEWLGWLCVIGAILFSLLHGALRLLGGRL